MRKHRSLGEMISTATFFGCGVFIFLYSMELLDIGSASTRLCWTCRGFVLYSGWVSLHHRKSS